MLHCFVAGKLKKLGRMSEACYPPPRHGTCQLVRPLKLLVPTLCWVAFAMTLFCFHYRQHMYAFTRHSVCVFMCSYKWTFSLVSKTTVFPRLNNAVTIWGWPLFKGSIYYSQYELVKSSVQNNGFEKSLLCLEDHDVATQGWSETSSISFVLLICYKMVHTQYFQSAFFFQRLHKSPALHVIRNVKSSWTFFGEHDQQSVVL